MVSIDRVKLMEEYNKKVGTTIVGIKGKDFVAIFGDSQSTFGNVALELETQKVYIINKYSALGGAGLSADISFLVKVLDLENRYYKVQVGDDMDIDLIKSLIFNVLYYKYLELPFAPFFVGIIFGGYSKEEDRFKLYSVDALGGGIDTETNYSSIGSGMDFALSVLDENYKENISLKEALELGLRAIKESKKRDVYTGGKRIDCVIINREKSYLLKGEDKIKEFIEKI